MITIKEIYYKQKIYRNKRMKNKKRKKEFKVRLSKWLNYSYKNKIKLLSWKIVIFF